MGCLFRRNKAQAGEEDDFDVIDSSRPETRASQAPYEKSLSRRGLSRLFSSKKSHKQQQHKVEDKSSTSEEEMQDYFPANGPPPTMPSKAPASFRPSQIESKVTERTIETDTTGLSSHPRTGNRNNPATLPPPARESAFHGPPRFDWIDIEYTAAQKIQALHRKNMVMTSLEQQGLSTSAIRNRKRRRKAVNRNYHSKVQQHAETPFLFNCCAAGLAFGALTEDDEQAYREYQKRQYEERVQQQAEHEDAIRRKYLQDHGIKEPDQIVKVLEGGEE